MRSKIFSNEYFVGDEGIKSRFGSFICVSSNNGDFDFEYVANDSHVLDSKLKLCIRNWGAIIVETGSCSIMIEKRDITNEDMMNAITYAMKLANVEVRYVGEEKDNILYNEALECFDCTEDTPVSEVEGIYSDRYRNSDSVIYKRKLDRYMDLIRLRNPVIKKYDEDKMPQINFFEAPSVGSYLSDLI